MSINITHLRITDTAKNVMRLTPKNKQIHVGSVISMLFFLIWPHDTSGCISSLQMHNINEQMCKSQIDIKEKL